MIFPKAISLGNLGINLDFFSNRIYTRRDRGVSFRACEGAGPDLRGLVGKFSKIAGPCSFFFKS